MATVAQPLEAAGPVLDIRQLSKRFGAVEVLRDIDLEMSPGDFLVLVGPSGCGKSTLLNCVAGLDETSAGEILIDGRNVTRVPPRDRDIAMVFQSYALYPTMTVAQNIDFGLRVRNVSKAERDRQTLDVATLLRIEHLLDRKPGQLSGGQRQRVAMGRALVRQPRLFLFDEPLSNLDAKLRVEMRGEIRKLHERLHTSIVYVTHDQIEAMTLGTRIAVLNQGTIQQIGTPDDIYRRPANMFVANFMGSPPMNLVSAICQGDSVVFGGAAGRLPFRHAGLREGPVIVGIRPEDFQPARGEGMLTLAADTVEHSGADTFVEFAMGERSAVARLPGRMTVGRGDKVALDVDVATLTFFDPETEKRIG